MTVVVDSSFVLALANRADAHHDAAAAWLAGEDEDLVTSPLVVSEVDAALLRHGDEAAWGAFRRDLEAGAYVVRWWADALAETIAVARRDAGAVLSLTEASLVAVAARTATDRIATFRTAPLQHLMARGGMTFTLLPDLGD